MSSPLDVLQLSYNELRTEIKKRNGNAAGKKKDLQSYLVKLMEQPVSSTSEPNVVRSPSRRSSRRKRSHVQEIDHEAEEDCTISRRVSSPARKAMILNFECVEPTLLKTGLSDDYKEEESIEEADARNDNVMEFEEEDRVDEEITATQESTEDEEHEREMKLLSDAAQIANDEQKKSVEITANESKIPMGVPPTRPRSRNDRFNAAHKAMFAKMENIEDQRAKVQARHLKLTTSAGPVFSRLATPKKCTQRAKSKNEDVGFEMGALPPNIKISIAENVDVVREKTFMSEKETAPTPHSKRSRTTKENRLDQVRPHVGTSVFDRLCTRKHGTTRRDEILQKRREKQEKENEMIEKNRTPTNVLTVCDKGIVDRLATPKSALKPSEAILAARREEGYKPHKGAIKFVDTLHLTDDEFHLLKKNKILKMRQGKMHFDDAVYEKVYAATANKLDQQRLQIIKKKL